MLTVSAERLIRGVNELWRGEFDDPSTQDFPIIRSALDLALESSWESEWWQSIVDIEIRYFRANWLAASTYNKTDEVYDAATQQYFQCLRNSVTGAGFSPTDSNGDERSAYWALSASSYSGNNWSSASVSYAVGDKVFYPVDNNYYQCHTAHTSSGTLTPDATGASERWGVLTPFQRYVDFDQTGETPIGEVLDVTNQDPRVTKRYRGVDADTIGDKLFILENATFVYVKFRKRRPSLSGSIFSSTSTYAVGDQVYYTTTGTVGNFYDCIVTTTAGQSPSTTPASWEVAEIPKRFEGFLIWRAYAQVVTGDGQDEKRIAAMAMAESYLVGRADVQFRQTVKGAPNLSVAAYR